MTGATRAAADRMSRGLSHRAIPVITMKVDAHRDLPAGKHQFLLTNSIPRRQLTRVMGWFSTVEQPVVRDLSIASWRLFAGDSNCTKPGRRGLPACTIASSAN